MRDRNRPAHGRLKLVPYSKNAGGIFSCLISQCHAEVIGVPKHRDLLQTRQRILKHFNALGAQSHDSVTPVSWPPGRASPSTSPVATGSPLTTTGMVPAKFLAARAGG